jgi:hypothetical protein
MTGDRRTELQRFQAFVVRQLESEGAVPTPEECLQLWREHCEVIDSVREGLAEAEAGLGIPLDEFLLDLRSWRHADVR